MKRVHRTRVPRSVPVGQYRKTLLAVRRLRLNVVFGLMLLGFGLLLGRLGQLQLVDAAAYRATWIARHESPVSLRARRGRLLDRHGYVLAEPKPCVGLAMDPSYDVIKDPDRFALRVAALTDNLVPAATIRERIQSARDDAAHSGREVPGHVRLISRIDDPLLVERLWEAAGRSTRARVREHLYGLLVEPIEGRWYPNRTEAAHLLGRVPADGVPGQGIEASLDERLRGVDVRGRTLLDGRGNRLARAASVARDATRGDDVFLTIDLVIQHHLERAVDRMVEEHVSLEAAGVVMDVRTGDVLAMTSRPTFDPNGGAPTLDRVTQGLYEPGSCFKPFTVAFALTDGVVSADDTIPMPPRVVLEHDPHPIRDDHEIGDGPIRDLLAQSSNTGSAWLAHRLGPERFATWLRHVFPYEWRRSADGRARLVAGTGCGLPWEKGYSRPADARTMSWVDLHRGGFGQGFALTPLQITAAFAAFARDDARVVRPRLVHGDGEAPRLGPCVVDPRHLETIREGLVACVEEGTGRRAFANCRFSAAGKTATSQSVQSVDERVAHLRGLVPGDRMDTNLCSFIAYAPAHDPQVVVFVLARQLKEDEVYGGGVAGPAVRAVIEATLAYWGVAPDREPAYERAWSDEEPAR